MLVSCANPFAAAIETREGRDLRFSGARLSGPYLAREKERGRRQHGDGPPQGFMMSKWVYLCRMFLQVAELGVLKDRRHLRHVKMAAAFAEAADSVVIHDVHNRTV